MNTPTTPQRTDPPTPAAGSGETPETDKEACHLTFAGVSKATTGDYVLSCFARRLERERNAARSSVAFFSTEGTQMRVERDALKQELVGCREQIAKADETLLAENESLRAQLALLRAAPTGQERELREALEGLVRVIEAAGVDQLSQGVELGKIAWYHKCHDALKEAKFALAQRPAGPSLDKPEHH